MPRFHGQVVRGQVGNILLESIDSEETNKKYNLDFTRHPELKPSFVDNYKEGSYAWVSGDVKPSFVTPYEILVDTFVFDNISSPVKTSETTTKDVYARTPGVPKSAVKVGDKIRRKNSGDLLQVIAINEGHVTCLTYRDIQKVNEKVSLPFGTFEIVETHTANL